MYFKGIQIKYIKHEALHKVNKVGYYIYSDFALARVQGTAKETQISEILV